ncbi:MAG: RNA 2',3'-cyclic phosphodiesterase [Verrucomicrobia bacterium]|nr:RNA 2',3'-cyclic phosphodiesterase [Verrucomicrobiota bacterium]
MRLFIAIPVEQGVIAALAEAQRHLKSVGGDAVRWTKPEQMHLTLKFFGEVPETEIGPLQAALQSCAHGAKPFHLCLDGLGCFPNPARPRVIWAGLAGDVARLRELQQSVGRATAAFGERQEEREFHPHLTLGRVRPECKTNLSRLGELIAKTPFNFTGDWPVTEMDLVRSELQPGGAVHSVLAKFNFSQAG